jgi:hypothetical protein
MDDVEPAEAPVSPRIAVTQMPPVVTRAEAARRSRVPSTHDDLSSLPSPMDDVQPTEAPVSPRAAVTQMPPVVTRAEAARRLQAPGGSRDDSDRNPGRNDRTTRDRDTSVDARRDTSVDARLDDLRRQLAVETDLRRQLDEAREINRARDLPRQIEQVTRPPSDTTDLYKVLKFARTVRRLDCITRSPSAWAEYVSDLRTCTLSSPLMRDCILHVEAQNPDDTGSPNDTAADHALFTLLQSTTTGLAHQMVSGLERSSDKPSGIAALRLLRDAVQPLTGLTHKPLGGLATARHNAACRVVASAMVHGTKGKHLTLHSFGRENGEREQQSVPDWMLQTLTGVGRLEYKPDYLMLEGWPM